MKKILITISNLIISIILVITLMPPIHAQSDEPYLGENLGISRCIANGNIEFLLFLRTFIWDDGFLDGAWEPWMDVLFRNRCQASDVSGLIKQRDKIRDLIRDAFLSCKSDLTPTLKRAYYELNAEVYYVRHVVDGNSLLGLPYITIDALNYSYVYPKNKLYSEMKEKYVGSEISEKKLDVIFKRFEAKYSHRVQSYVTCDSSSWDMVAEKWGEFIDNLGGLQEGWDSMKKGVGGKATKLWQDATDLTYFNWMTSFVDLNINDQSPMATFGEMYDEITKDISIPTFTPTFGTMTDTLSEKNFEFDIESTKTELFSRYTVLYRDTSDAGVSAILQELHGLNNTIKASFDALNKVLQCSIVMNARQCPGN